MPAKIKKTKKNITSKKSTTTVKKVSKSSSKTATKKKVVKKTKPNSKVKKDLLSQVTAFSDIQDIHGEHLEELLKPLASHDDKSTSPQLPEKQETFIKSRLSFYVGIFFGAIVVHLFVVVVLSLLSL